MVTMRDDTIGPEEVITALERVLSSDQFRSAYQSRSFLAYVVTETLAGRGERLSERTVGRQALYRRDDFDGRFDAGVRVQATRVRKALAAYYEANTDPVRITLATGSYAPKFQRVQSSQEPHLETAVAITSHGDDPGSHALAQEMSAQLDAFPGLRVIGPVQAADEDSRAVASRLQTRFVLHVAAVSDPHGTHAELSVFDATSSAQVWTMREALPDPGLERFDVQRWASGIASQIGDYTGVIITRVGESRGYGEDQWQAMQAYYAMFLTGDTQDVVIAVRGLQRCVDRGQSSPALTAALAHCLSLRAGYGLSDDSEADLNRATQIAQSTLLVDHGSATAHLALATVALVSEQHDVAREHARKAMDLAPFHPSIVGSAGTLLAYSGDWSGGLAGIRQALHLNPNMPGFSRFLLVVDHIFAGDDALALLEAALIATPTEVWGPYCRALALMGLGYTERARAEMDVALEIDPHVLDDDFQVITEWMALTSHQRGVLRDRLTMFQ
jgi:tetratricopeptide (TPR) repeat protein